MTEKTNSGGTSPANVSAKWNVPTGRRTDEWSEALVLVGDSQDRAAFTRFFRHFAPLIKAFALSGSSLSAAHADELVQEVMLKVWQKAGGFNPEKAAASTWVYTIARNCRTDMFRRLQKFDTPLASDDFELESEEEESFVVLHTRRGSERVRELMGDLPRIRLRSWAKSIWRVNLTPRQRPSSTCRWAPLNPGYGWPFKSCRRSWRRDGGADGSDVTVFRVRGSKPFAPLPRITVV